MAIRRTREDKQRAQVRREEQLTYTWSAPKSVSKKKLSNSSAGAQNTLGSAESAAGDILGYAPRYIYQDLFKTVVMTMVCLVILVMVKMYIFS